MTVTGRVIVVLLFLFFSWRAQAVYCENGGCQEGIDPSGRTPGAMYDAAAEVLKSPKSETQRTLARRAMKDAFNPKMSDPRAIECNKAGGSVDFRMRPRQGAGPGIQNDDALLPKPC